MQKLAIGLTLCILVLSANRCGAHDGPDPIARWRFDAAAISAGEEQTQVNARLGPRARILGDHQLLDDDDGGTLFMEGKASGLLVAEDYSQAKKFLPTQAMTASAWVSVDRRERWGGLAGVIQDNGADEAGWILGYNDRVFTFGLASQNGNGRITYLAGKTEYELGRLYHVVAVYDGQTMQLFVNGQLESESSAQSGSIAYPERAPFVLGAYRDDDEFHSHRGRLSEIALYDLAAKPKWVAQEFSHNAELAKREAAPIYEPLDFAIRPYLQFGTRDGMTVMWKTNGPASTTVRYGETAECEHVMTTEAMTEVHEMRIEDLQPETQYFYKVESKAIGSETTIHSEVATFQTAVNEETPFAFAVISDTQGNPAVSGKVANYAWGQRPNFLLHPGDLVSTGGDDSHWTEHFFPSMNPLIRHVPFYSVLGNHEQNARNYFDYVSLPDPEYFYTFRFGNSQFFMIDSNRNVDPDSEQYRWLEEALQDSTATWKIVCHHHPPYSSDENDYGDLWKTNESTRGDLRARQLVTLYEQYDVDVVWNGHIHSYERTWPVQDGRAVEKDAPIYMITGGGGGSLETPGPVRPFFQNTVRRGHHYAMVRVNGTTMEIQAYDLENRLFDTLTISKRSAD